MAVQTISLDFWGTLVQANPEFKQVKIDLVHNHFHAALDPVDITATQRVVKRHYDNLVEAWGIQPTQATLFSDWFHKLGLEPERYSFNHLQRFIDSYQAAAYILPAVPYDELITGNLQALARDFKLILISNTLFVSGATIRAWLHALGWAEYFDQLIFSDEAGLAKPNPRIFGLAHRRIDTHIGDNPRTDAFGARQAGIAFIGVNGAYHHTLTDAYNRLKNG